MQASDENQPFKNYVAAALQGNITPEVVEAANRALDEIKSRQPVAKKPIDDKPIEKKKPVIKEKKHRFIGGYTDVSKILHKQKDPVKSYNVDIYLIGQGYLTPSMIQFLDESAGHKLVDEKYISRFQTITDAEDMYNMDLKNALVVICSMDTKTDGIRRISNLVNGNEIRPDQVYIMTGAAHMAPELQWLGYNVVMMKKKLTYGNTPQKRIDSTIRNVPVGEQNLKTIIETSLKSVNNL